MPAPKMPPPSGERPRLMIGIAIPKPGASKDGPMPPPGSAPQDPDADQDQDAGDRPIDPAWVDYHGEDERCEGCSMYGGGQCTLLKMQVDAGGHCRAFDGGGGGMGGYGGGQDEDSNALVS